MSRPSNLRTMYDAVTASNIPRSAAIVAGYVDQIVLKPWSVADWNLFPNAIHVQIVKKASSIFGNVLDVEKGDATSAQVPGWLSRMRGMGFVPSVYTSYSNWNAVQSAVSAAGLTQPPYWIADYSQNPVTWWPTLNGIDAVAWQYTDFHNEYDLSLVAPFWEGIDNMALTPDDIAAIWAYQFSGFDPLNNNAPMSAIAAKDWLATTNRWANAGYTQATAVLAALPAPGVTVTDAQMAELEVKLVAALPKGWNVAITPAP